MPGTRKWGKLAAALTLGLLLRLFFLWRFQHVVGDSLVYGDIARNLLEHGVYGFNSVVNGVPGPPRPTLIRLPGYPIFLASCFAIFGSSRYVPVLLVQIAMDLVTCVLLGGIARRLYGIRAEMPAIWLGALCPFTANYTVAPLTETPTIFCIALAFYALVRWREAREGQHRETLWLCLLAAALAWALLLRPEQGMLAAAIVPCVFWISWRRRGPSVKWIAPTVLVSVLTLLPLLPWTVRNYRTFHLFQPLAPRFANDPGEIPPYGFQRWYRTWAIDYASTDLVYWNYDGTTLSINDLPSRAFDSPRQLAETAQLIDDYNLQQNATAALDARWNAIASERIHVAPMRYYFAMPAGRLLNMAFRPRTENLPVPLEWWHSASGHRFATLFAWIYSALNLGYFAFAALGVWRGPRGAVVWSMVATVLLRCVLLLTIDNSEMRYTLEFFPVFIVLAAGAVSRSLVRRDTVV